MHAAPEVLASVLITLTAATFTLVMRFFGRHVASVNLWWDDWFALAAYVKLFLLSIAREP
jgi:hypothetical protein